MISNSGHDENNRYSGGAAGDQTGGEWAVIPWYNRPWNYVLRYPDRKVGNLLAELARAAALNNCIGYDQGQRTSYWQQLKANQYHPERITVPCEADCSSGVAANVKAAGYLLGIKKLQNVSAGCYTGNLRSALKTAGFQVLTARKYLNSPDYLLPGDILLYEGHHTAINLDVGSKAGGAVTGNVALGQQWLNSNYGTLIIRATGSLLEVDNAYGSHSRWAALAVWKDVVNRKYGYSLTPSNPNFGKSCREAARMAVIRKGDRGTFSYLIEFILSAHNLYTGAMDAEFGSGLQSAVLTFQKRHYLQADGIAGPDTWNALFH